MSDQDPLNLRPLPERLEFLARMIAPEGKTLGARVALEALALELRDDSMWENIPSSLVEQMATALLDCQEALGGLAQLLGALSAPSLSTPHGAPPAPPPVLVGEVDKAVDAWRAWRFGAPPE